MSLTNTTTKVKYAGDNVTTSFTITFDFILNSSECKVILRDETDPDNITETLQVDGVDYNLTGASPPSIPFPTTVEMVTAPTSDQELLIYREVPLTQLLDYLETSEFRAESQEKGLDKLTAMVQEIAEQLTRAALLSRATDANLPISYPEPKANNVIGWDDEADDLRNYTAAELLEEVVGLVLLKANNLSDVDDVPTSRTNLGLGSTDNVNHNSLTLVANLSAADVIASGKVDSGAEVEFETFLDTATITTPSNPTAGRFKLYMKADGNLYKLDEFGTETVVAGGNEFADNLFRIQDDGDNTKEIAFEASGIATGTTRTITMPDEDIDLTASSDTVGSFSNRTLSNLGTTAFNADIIPDDAGTRSIGSAAARLLDVFVTSIKATANAAIDVLNRRLLSNSGQIQLDWGNDTFFSIGAQIFRSTFVGPWFLYGNTDQNVTLGGLNSSSGDYGIQTGNNGASPSGDVFLIVGSGTPQGEFRFLKSGVPSVAGQVWTATGVNGEGYWSAATGGGDAWSDPVDANIVPDGDSTRNIGTANGSRMGIITATTLRADGGDFFQRSANGFQTYLRTQTAYSMLDAGLASVLRGADPQSGRFGIVTQNESGTDNTADLLIETGRQTGSAGDSGKMSFKIGSSANGTQGEFSFLKEGVAPNIGDVLTASAVDGTCYWAAPAAGGVAGGAGGLTWQEDGAAPLLSQEFGAEVYRYADGITQDLYTQIEVVPDYTAGNPIAMRINWYSPEAANNGLIRAEATLIRPGTDAFDSTTNQRTTTNTAVTLTVANQVNSVSLDLTDGTGQINAVAVSAGDIIKIRLFRDTDTSTQDIRFVPGVVGVSYE